jgi:tetratricopeptide (TPR) repeat protein
LTRPLKYPPHSPTEATKAFKRALLSSEPGEIALLYRLASLAADQGHLDDAAAYHRHVIAIAPKEDIPLADYARSFVALARFEIDLGPERGDLVGAERYLSKVLESTLEVRARARGVRLSARVVPDRCGAQEKEEANELLKRLRRLQLQV